MTMSEVITQIDRALDVYDEKRAKSKYDDLSDLGRAAHLEIKAIVSTTLARVAPQDSLYRQSLAGRILANMVSDLRVLRRDLEDGLLNPNDYMRSVAVPNTNIFISHGSPSRALSQVEKFVRALGLTPVIVKDRPSLGGSVDDVVEAQMKSCSASISIATKDAEVDGAWRTRENVIHEIALATQMLHNRVIYLKEGDCNYPSNVRPKIWENFTSDNLEDAFIKIAKELHGFGLL